MEIPKYWIIIPIIFSEIFTCMQEGIIISKEHLEGLDLRNIRHYRRASKSEAKLVAAHDDAIIVKLPKFNNCNELERFKYVTRTSGKSVQKGKMNTCVALGGNRFYFGRIIGNKDRKGIFFLQRKGDSQPFVVLYGNLPPKSTKVPKIDWVVVGSSGPGWIDLRFKSKGSWSEYLTYRIKYRKLMYNTLGDRYTGLQTSNVVPGINNFISYKHDPLTVVPAYPCPEWEDKGIFCAVLTDFVNPEPESIERYSDYEIIIYSYRVDPDSYKAVGPQPSGGHVVNVRVWETCDPTYSCPQYMRPLYADSGGLPPTSLYEFQVANETQAPTERSEEFGESDSFRLNPVKKVPKVVRVMRKLWPLFLVLFLIILLIVAPWFFFFIRRRAMEERINNWYTGTTPTGFVEYTMALPVHVQIPTSRTRARGQGQDQGQDQGQNQGQNQGRSRSSVR